MPGVAPSGLLNPGNENPCYAPRCSFGDTLHGMVSDKYLVDCKRCRKMRRLRRWPRASSGLRLWPQLRHAADDPRLPHRAVCAGVLVQGPDPHP